MKGYTLGELGHLAAHLILSVQEEEMGMLVSKIFVQHHKLLDIKLTANKYVAWRYARVES